MKNLQNTPSIILESKSIGHPIDFKWNKKKINQFLDPLERNTELENALLQINHKASMGLTAALLEWVNWRFKGYTKMTEETQKRIEAIWCSIDNVKNTKPLTFDDNFDLPAAGHINGVLWIALMNVRMIDVMYRKGSYFIQSELVGLVLLARHITPKKRVFDKWLRTIIIELIHQYPSQYYNENLDETDEAIYDSSDESVICRNFFFDPEFQYSTEASEKAINELIHNLDTKSNQFLCFPKKAS
ncbi:hypothetical protein [Flavobacterium aquidurense]|uniref:Uncharacterized protein n=1 Tax=Flavobacterium aquidurense TaxID=362413 RepID=A0A0N8VMX5_9FLAO|nr:hypothetical protein [Flavobacterium aquidurense]KQB40540.1 hypothetical protein RC62_433 [Flavobacterium aquidurense]